MLHRHCSVMRAAQIHMLHPEEMPDAAACIFVIRDALQLRYLSLSGRLDVASSAGCTDTRDEALFHQRRLIVVQEGEEYACGMVCFRVSLRAV